MSLSAVADDNSAVYVVFRAHFDQLMRAMLSSPSSLIPVFYSKELISEDDKNILSTTNTNNMDLATKILNAVEVTIKSVPKAAEVVRKLCEAVNGHPALRHVADSITKALGE